MVEGQKMDEQLLKSPLLMILTGLRFQHPGGVAFQPHRQLEVDKFKLRIDTDGLF